MPQDDALADGSSCGRDFLYWQPRGWGHVEEDLEVRDEVSS